MRVPKSYGMSVACGCHASFKWKQEKIGINRSKKFLNTRQATRWLLERYGNKCKICKRKNWCGKPLPLVMDHIDGNSENYAVKNCRLICCNCDAQPPTYKGKNKGNGRYYKRQRYLENQSY